MSRINRTTAYQREKKPIFFSKSSADPLAAWRISGIKGPVFEQWYFDSVSDDGKSSIVMIFARDASYAMLGHGHFRMEFDIVFPDGKHFNHTDWMSEAVLEDTSNGGKVVSEGYSKGAAQSVQGVRRQKENDVNDGDVGHTHGVWTGKGRRYEHTIAADGSSAQVSFDGPEIQGSFTLKSTGPPYYPTGEIHPVDSSYGDISTELCPKIHWMEVIPTAIFTADLKVQGRPLHFEGIGGHSHIWAEGSWFDTVRGWKVCRAVAGPWSFTIREFTSLLDGKTYSSGYVARGGKEEFGALSVRAGKDSLTNKSNRNEHTGDDVVEWEPTHQPGVSGPHQDKSTGCIIKVRSGKSGEEWRFQLAHKHVAFDVAFGGADSGLTGFLSKASGGKVGERVYDGVGHANVNVLPREYLPNRSRYRLGSITNFAWQRVGRKSIFSFA